MATHNYPDAHDLPDRQQEQPFARCPECGGEIYPGERCYKIGWRYYHMECVDEVIADEEES